MPVSQPPIHGGWIRLAGDTIREMVQGPPPPGAEDLGDVALLPGLVNAHTHLEFSDCRRPIGKPGTPLHQWIGQVIAARGETTDEEKQQAVARGLRESRSAGVALIGEITTPPCQYPAEASHPHLVTFAEVLGLDPDRANCRIEAARHHVDRHHLAGWSPHAPYSTTIETIEFCVEDSATSGRPLAMHVAESPAERELLSCGTGPFSESLRQLSVWRDGLFPWGKDPLVSLIDRLSKAARVLLVHGNDLQPNEIQHLSEHSHLSVVYCPRTHAFFGYDRHPVAQLLASGVRVAIGTDSRASNPDLNLWREVQFLLKHRADLAPQKVLEMATTAGADALAVPAAGRIEVGCRPGLGCVATMSATIEGVYDDLVEAEYVSVC